MLQQVEHGTPPRRLRFLYGRLLQMTLTISGFQTLRFSMLAVLLVTTGCQSDPNFHRASQMPKGLRIARSQSTQEVDFGQLASVGGRTDEIGSGDLLEVSIASSLKVDDEVSRTVRVATDGSVTLPSSGQSPLKVHLAGQDPQTAAAVIESVLIQNRLYRNPTVTVDIAKPKMNRIRVVGAVNIPGLVELPPNSSDLVSAIAMAGGLAENASANVTIRNPRIIQPSQRRAIAGGPHQPYSTVSDTTEISGGMKPYTINLISAARDGSAMETIEDGGVVMVNKHDPEPIRITGLVHKPDSYDYPVDKPPTVLGAIAMAGGSSSQVANKVYVIRPMSQPGKRAVIEVSIRRAKRDPQEDILLGPGDIVSVEQTPSTILMEAFQLIRFGISGSTALL